MPQISGNCLQSRQPGFCTVWEGGLDVAAICRSGVAGGGVRRLYKAPS
jgi:hypothetical protein